MEMLPSALPAMISWPNIVAMGTETATTLREIHLKLLEDGIVLRSQACLIGNTPLLHQNERALRIASMMLDLIEAHMQARNRSILTAFIPGESVDRVQQTYRQLK